MQIGELSAKTGASPRMLRHYEKSGLLSPERSANGYRHYSESDVENVLSVRCLLEVGLSLADATHVTQALCVDQQPSDEDREEALARIRARRDQLSTVIDRLTTEKANLEQIYAELTE